MYTQHGRTAGDTATPVKETKQRVIYFIVEM